MIGNVHGRSNGGSPSSSSSLTFRLGSGFDDDGGGGGGLSGLPPPLSPIDGNRRQNQRRYHQQWRGMGGSPGASEKNVSNDRGGSSYHQQRYESRESSGGLFQAAAAASQEGGGGGLEAFKPEEGLESEHTECGYESGEWEQQPYGYSHEEYSHQHYDRCNNHQQRQEECDHYEKGEGPRRLQLQMEDENENNDVININDSDKFEIDLSPNSSSSENNGGGGKAAAAAADDDELGLSTTSPRHHHHHHHHHQRQRQLQQHQQTFFYSNSDGSNSHEDGSSSLTNNNSSALPSSTMSFQSSSFADGNGSGGGSHMHTGGFNDAIFRTAKKRRYEYSHDDDAGHNADHEGTSMAITPPVESVPSPSSYQPNDPRFWSYSVGKYAHRRSCHERFGHSWPLPERDRAVWTRRDFAFSSRVLGTGNFGEVRLVRCREDGGGGSGNRGNNSGSRGAVLAIKAISKEEILKSRQGIAIARREIEIQTRLHHPNILGCQGYFHDRSSLYLVLEYANGRDLFALFKKKQMMLADDRRRRLAYGDRGDDDHDDNGDDDQYVATLPHSLAARITRQVAQALLYLESKNVAHRDIKLENIMLHYPSGSRDNPMNAQIKLVDFGWASWCHFPSGHRHFTLCGTPEYIAPEILKSCLPSKPRLSTMVGSLSNPMSVGYDARYVDAWSLGVMAFELISNQTPFGFPAGRDYKDDNNQQIFASIQRFDDDDLESLHVGRDVPHEWRLFGRIVRGLLRTNPMERLSMKQVLDHPWLKV